jgi:hypothetical protein
VLVPLGDDDVCILIDDSLGIMSFLSITTAKIGIVFNTRKES